MERFMFRDWLMRWQRLARVRFVGQVNGLKTQAGFECYDLEAEYFSNLLALRAFT